MEVLTFHHAHCFVTDTRFDSELNVIRVKRSRDQYKTQSARCDDHDRTECCADCAGAECRTPDGRSSDWRGPRSRSGGNAGVIFERGTNH